MIIIEGFIVIGRLIRKTQPFAVRAFKFIVRKFLLSAILSVYFLFLKLRKEIRGLTLSSAQRLIRWLNRSIYKFTVIAILLFTLVHNLAAQTPPLEKIESDPILAALITPLDEAPATIIEEGPLPKTATANITSYLDQESVLTDTTIMSPTGPEIDDDFYATIEGDSAIIAPTIIDLSALNPSNRDKTEDYVVEPGDTIGTIAQKFGLSVNTVLWQNRLTWNSTIRPGNRLSILPISGLAHKVASGETLERIAKKYQANTDQIITFNKLASSADIRTGEILIIPGGVKPTEVVVRAPQPVSSILKDIFSPVQDTGTKLLWPLLSRRMTQYFTLRHSGVDVGDKKGQPIFAAESGRVERSGWTGGYGLNVVINHGNGLKTLYAHSSELLVKVGEVVSRGQIIARIGSTGRSTGPHLHFEVLINGRRTNPLNYSR